MPSESQEREGLRRSTRSSSRTTRSSSHAAEETGREKEKESAGGRKRRRSRSRSRSRERRASSRRSRSRSRSASRETRSSSRRTRRGGTRSPSPSRSASRPRRGQSAAKAAEEPPAPASADASNGGGSKKARVAAAPSPAPAPAADPMAIARAKAEEIARKLKAREAAAAVAPQAVPQVAAASLQAAALQEQIRRQMEQVQAALKKQQEEEAAAREQRKPVFKPMRFDDQGREIDEHGNVVQVDLSAIRSVRANLPAGAKRDLAEPAAAAAAAAPDAAAPAKKAKTPKAEEEEDDANAAFMDPRLKVKDRSRRAHRGLAFVDPGTYVRMAERQRAKEHGAMMGGFASGRNPRAYSRSGILEVAEDAAITAAAAAAAGGKEGAPAPPQPMVSLQALPLPPSDATAPQPMVEWWDEPFLPKAQRAELAKDPNAYTHAALTTAKTHTYIQHPVPLKGTFAGKEDAEKAALVMPTYLTKRERKRLRRQTRKEREQEKRDKIALGLMPQPEPKLNLTNFMKVLANESIADPSAVTAKIQQQIREREKNHEMRNLARKLTPEERREKKRRKIVNDLKKRIEVAVFRVRALTSPKIRYKIDVNAQQTGLSGAVLTCRDPAFGEEGIHLVVVEGGPRAIRRYIKLMLRRIKWDQRDGDEVNQDNDDDEDEEEEHEAGASSGASKTCELVWKGVVAKPAFTGFKFQETKTITTARKVMESRGVVHYFDAVISSSSDGLGVGI